MLELKHDYTIALVTHNMQQAVALRTLRRSSRSISRTAVGLVISSRWAKPKQVFEAPREQLTRNTSAATLANPILRGSRDACMEKANDKGPATLAGVVWMIVAALLGPAMAEGPSFAVPARLWPRLSMKSGLAPFQQAHPSVIVHYEAIGSGEGVARFIAGRWTLAPATCRNRWLRLRRSTRGDPRYQSRPEWSCLHTISLV